MKLPDWLILWTWQSLIGEIYPEIRAIALRYTEDKNLLIRFYLEREPVDEDSECIESIITNILAHTSSNEEILNVKDESIFSNEKIGDLDPLDGFIYARKE